jgi:hypothetical protein
VSARATGTGTRDQVLDHPELGTEAGWGIEVRDAPAYVVDEGDDVSSPPADGAVPVTVGRRPPDRR